MTQKELAELIGVSRQTVNTIERNKYSPSLEMAFRIANIFGTSIENIFFYEPDTEGKREFADGAIVDVSWGGARTRTLITTGASDVLASLPVQSTVVTRRSGPAN